MEFKPSTPLTLKTDVNVDSDGYVAQAGVTTAGVKTLSFPMMSANTINRWSDTKTFAVSIIESLGGGTFDQYSNRLSVDYTTDEGE